MRRALLLALALGGGAFAQSGGHAGHGETPGAPVGSSAHLKTLKGRAFDVAWTGRMIAHHQMAIDMAEAELTGGRNAQVKAAARQVIAAQRREIDLMKSWRKSWGTGVGSGMVMDFVRPAPGQSWDRWFLTGMIPHHQGAVEMAKLVPTRTQNAAVRKLAREIIASQSAEINQYRAWLKSVQ